MIARSFAVAAYLMGRGFAVERTGLDPHTSRPYFIFPDEAMPHAAEYRKTVHTLNALVAKEMRT
jgi:hypothetical protein